MSTFKGEEEVRNVHVYMAEVAEPEFNPKTTTKKERPLVLKNSAVLCHHGRHVGVVEACEFILNFAWTLRSLFSHVPDFDSYKTE